MISVPDAATALPTQGDVVCVRTRTYLVESVEPGIGGHNLPSPTGGPPPLRTFELHWEDHKPEDDWFPDEMESEASRRRAWFRLRIMSKRGERTALTHEFGSARQTAETRCV